jgi:hypothetical protein
MDTDVTDWTHDDAPPEVAVDHGDQGDVLSWFTGAGKRRREKASVAQPPDEESLRSAWAALEDSVDLSSPEPVVADPAEKFLPERDADEPDVTEAVGTEAPAAESDVAESVEIEPEVAEREPITPPAVKDRPDVRVRAWRSIPVEPPPKAQTPIANRVGERFRWRRVLGAVFVGSVLAATVMLAMVAAPDLLRERGRPNVSTLTVRTDRPVPTSRQFSVTLSNASDHSVVSACTATVTNPAGTRAVASARFAVGPIPPRGALSFEGRLKWVGNKSKMAPGIAVGCTERSA